VAPGDLVEDVPAGVVRVVRNDQLILRSELQGLQQRVDPHGDVGHEGELVRVRPHEGAEHLSGTREQRGAVAEKEAHRLALELDGSAPRNAAGQRSTGRLR